MRVGDAMPPTPKSDSFFLKGLDHTRPEQARPNQADINFLFASDYVIFSCPKHPQDTRHQKLTPDT